METKNDILNKVKEVVGRYEDIKSISNEDSLNELKISDLSKVQISMEIERIFDVDFDINMISNIKNVADLVSFIENAKS